MDMDYKVVSLPFQEDYERKLESTELEPKLEDLTFEVDKKLEYMKPRISEEGEKLFSGTEKKKEVKKQERNAENLLSIQPTTAQILLEEKKSKENFIHVFESSSSVHEARKALGINYDSPDLLLSKIPVDKMSQSKKEVQILFSPISFKFEVATKDTRLDEKIVCSATLYDVEGPENENCKVTQISEIFKFNFDQKPENALFKVSGLDKGIHLLLRFSRVFKGEETEVFNDILTGGLEKYKTSTVDYSLNRLKNFKPDDSTLCPFGWVVVPLLDAIRSKKIIKNSIFCRLNEFGSDQQLVKSWYSKEIEKDLTSYKPKNRILKCNFEINVFSNTKLQIGTKKYISDQFPSKIITQKVVKNETGKQDKVELIAREIVSFESCLHETNITNYLYVYPKSLILPLKQKLKNVMIQIELKNDDKLESVLNACFDPYTGEIKPFVCTELEYKNYNPFFQDEIKIRLPSTLSHKQHILFKFYHINHKFSGKSSKQFFGFAYKTISDGDNFILSNTSQYQLPIYVAKSEKDLKYLDMDNMEKMDGGKNLFTFKIRLNSSLFTDFPDMDHFLAVYNKASSPKLVKPKEMIDALKLLKPNCSNYPGLVTYILNQLLSLLEVENEDVRNLAFKNLMVFVDDILKTENLKHVVPYFVKFIMKFETSSFILQFITKARQYTFSCPADIFYNVAWFIFSCLLKSISLWQNSNPNIEMTTNMIESINDFLADIPTLMVGFSKTTNEDELRYNQQNYVLSREVGAFLRNLFSLLDRGIVMGFSNTFIKSVQNIKSKREIISQLTIQIELNFFDEILKYKNIFFLFIENEKKEKEFVIINSFVETLINALVCNDRDVRLKATTIYRDFLYRFAIDSRYQSRELQMKIHEIHFDFFKKFIDIFHTWNLAVEKKTRDKELLMNTTNKKIQDCDMRVQEIEASIESNKEKKNDPTLVSKHHDPLSNLLFQKSLAKETKRLYDNQEKEFRIEKRIAKNEKIHMFSCIIHIIENLDPQILEKWHTISSVPRVLSFLNLLETIQITFEYCGRDELLEIYKYIKEIKDLKEVKEVKEINNEQESGHAMMTIAPNSTKNSRPKSRKNASQHYIQSELETKLSTGFLKATPQEEVEKRVPFETNISHRAGMFVFEILTKYIERNKEQLFKLEKDIDNSLLNQVVRIFINFLRLNQSDVVMELILHYLRYFISIEPKILFNHSDIYEVFSSLLDLCQYKIEHCRVLAVSLFYLCIKYSYIVSNGIAKPKLLATRSLSGIFGTENGSQTVHTDLLLSCFEQVVHLASSDQNAPKEEIKKIDEGLNEKVITFVEHVQDLCYRLRTLIKHIVTVWEEQETPYPYKIEDLLIRISEGYSHIPEVRFIWLEKLAQHHLKKKNYIEAAQCYLRILATVFEMLQKHPTKSEMLKNIPVRFVNEIDPFLKLRFSNNSLQEEEEKTEEEIQLEGGYFEEDNLINFIIKICDQFEKGEFYENSATLYKIVLSFYERTYHYQKMSEIYEKLKTLHQQIHNKIKDKAIHYPCNFFYRIRFYGAKMGELDGQDYIYKFRRNCKLYEVVKMVKEWFKSKGDIQLISHSDKVDKTEIDHENSIYAQITFVTPYISETDSLTERKTLFQKNTLIDKFYHEVPYKPEGWKKDYEKIITKQYKKRTIITVQHHFPYLITRLQKTDVTTKILDPIEAATEVIQDRNSLIQESLFQPVNLEQLQMHVSGAVQARVNGGPGDIVQSFLDPNTEEKFDSDKVKILNDSCVEFIDLIRSAIAVEEKALNSSDKKDPKQIELHQQMVIGYKETKQLFDQYLKYDIIQKKDLKK